MAQTALQVADSLLLVLQHMLPGRSFVLFAFLVHHHPISPAYPVTIASSAHPHCGGDLRPHLWGNGQWQAGPDEGPHNSLTSPCAYLTSQ